MKLPIGFKFSGVACGIKPMRPDLALFVSETDATCAGAFTINLAKAAPVVDAEARLPADRVRAIVVNSGNANALTGPAGAEGVRSIIAAAAAALGVDTSQVVSASTGVIGMPMPAEKLVKGMPAAVAQLSPDPDKAAEAIMTTDTTKKLASRTIDIDGKSVTLAGICKGSGMIAPQLATVIAVIVTDCAIDAKLLDASLDGATRETFEQLTIDGDMSTNDSVFVLANGRAKNPKITRVDSPAYQAFSAALSDLLDELARDIAADGEGATKRIEVHVAGAPTHDIARDLARSICGSPLVKAAIFGADPNWGRILATVGARAGVLSLPIDPHAARVIIQGVTVYDKAPIPFDRGAIKTKLRDPEVAIIVELRAGDHIAKAYGCDLSYDYVKLNADYTSLIIEKADGGIAKDDKLTNYTPSFKRAVLVEALGYISRFRGKRCVIKLGGAAIAKDGALRAFCDDVMLLHQVGLTPVVVHGGGAAITRALEARGSETQYVDGLRVTNAEDIETVESVLDAINADLVAMLNRRGGHAIGLSGSDAALLRAKKLVRPDGKDLGHVGQLTEVNKTFLESMLAQQYIPVVSPIGLGPEGESFNMNADTVAAGIAKALGVEKLIFLSDVPGIVENGELVTDLTPSTLRARLTTVNVQGGMALKVASILDALDGGVKAVHLIDGRTPHNVIAELFTDRGVGTVIRAEGA
ncbi:MAG: bifunctional glutamate N-acetyltransferase/amino-acid acetyltransferase ArgJ [Deltaproteobacteria bacterium]|nr:bifunctional glutamate N-acetyltransferase/amino-acid acetyltransferase ArgJ [Deltaproteobacteria bacterium]